MNSILTPEPGRTYTRAPKNMNEKLDMWVQEDIFGHRFENEQKPYILVLEALCVCDAVIGKGGAPFCHGAGDETISASIAKRGPLRYLLFSDSALEQIKQNENLTDDEKLERLIDELNKGYQARGRVENAFDYLREKFDGRFPALAQAVEILRSMEIDTQTGRRWTSRFLAPRGGHLLFPDISPKMTSDRRFFGRGGELVYLMLSRSEKSAEASDLVRKTFFNTEDPMDMLIAELESGPDERTGDARLGYLPLVHHASYDRLAEDWIAILGLGTLPPPQKFDPLFRLTALNIVRYIADRSAEVSDSRDSGGRPVMEPIVLDVSGGAITDLRKRAIGQLRRVREAIDEAVEVHIRTTLSDNPRWARALSCADAEDRFRLAIKAIEESFKTRVLSKAALSRRSPEACLSFFLKEAAARRHNNVSTVIEPLGKGAGFITARRSAGTWFDASDEFLESLVIGNTGAEAITVDAFLARIFDRYRIVIGPNEATRAFARRAADPASFEENMKILERRLTGLGYVKRLSDDCAFVSNPYAM